MRLIKLLGITFLLTVIGCTNDSDSDLLENTENEMVTYTGIVKQIIDQNCVTCHGVTPINGAPMSLHTYENVKEAVLNRGLIDRITRIEGQPGAMPFGGPRLPQTQIDQIIQWQNEDFPL